MNLPHKRFSAFIYLFYSKEEEEEEEEVYEINSPYMKLIQALFWTYPTIITTATSPPGPVSSILTISSNLRGTR